jgi:hypothetical protein
VDRDIIASSKVEYSITVDNGRVAWVVSYDSKTTAQGRPTQQQLEKVGHEVG